MKITPMASEFVGILASVVKTSQGYMTYIGVVLANHKAYCTVTTRIGHTSLFIRSTSSIHDVIMCMVWALHVVVINCGMYPVLQIGHYMYLITCTCV